MQGFLSSLLVYYELTQFKNQRRQPMKKTQETLRTKDNTKTAVLYIAFELSHRKWKLAFSNAEKMRTVTIEARNLEQLQAEINKAKKRFRIDKQLRVVSSYRKFAQQWYKLEIPNVLELPKNFWTIDIGN
jgi:hypothetical protein